MIFAKIFITIMGALVILGGIDRIRLRRRFAPVDTVIVRIEKTSSRRHAERTVYVSYEAGGRQYESRLPFYRIGLTEGMTVKAKYDPSNPSRLVEADITSVIIMFAGGIALIAFALSGIFG